MKTLTIIILSLLPLISHSQQLYMNLSSGYNFTMAPQNLTSYSFNSYFSVVYPYVIQKVDVSLGKGTNFDLTIGYQSRKNIGFELLATYQLGSETTAHGYTSDNQLITRSIYANMTKINPTIRFCSQNERFNAFMNIGFIAGVGKIYLTQRRDANDTILNLYENEFSGGMAFGLNGGIGISYRLNARLTFFGQFTFTAMSYAPKKGEIIKYVKNDEDVLSTLTVSQREIQFVDEIQYTQDQEQDIHSPSISLKHSYPFNSFGFKFGVSFTLWEKEDRE